MPKITCSRCGETREVVRVRKSKTNLCRKCSSEVKREKSNPLGFKHRIHLTKNGKMVAQYLRVCSCGDEKWVSYIPKPNQECRSCSAKKSAYAMSRNNIKPEGEHTIYKHTCSKCGKVRWLKASPKQRKTSLCGDCSRVAIGKANKRKKECTNQNKDFSEYAQTVRPETATVEVASKQSSGIKKCRKHSKPKKYKTSGKPRKSRTVSKEAIELQRKINKEHREAVKKRKADT